MLQGIYIQTGADAHVTHAHMLAEQIQTWPRGGAVLYPHVAEGRGDEVQKKKLETKLEELVRRGREAERSWRGERGEERRARTNKTSDLRKECLRT